MKHRKEPRCRYQMMTEYWIMAVICIFVLSSTVWVLGFLAEYAWRILALISLDYP